MEEGEGMEGGWEREGGRGGEGGREGGREGVTVIHTLISMVSNVYLSDTCCFRT